MKLQILKPSRKRLKPGQVFAFKYEDVYGFGRIIRTDAVIGPMTGCIMIYVYRYVSEELSPPVKLLREDLLFPPLMINRLPWSKGYLQVLEDRELKEEDTLDVHCFFSPFKRTFHDEYDNILSRPVEPIGQYGLGSYASLDERLIQSNFNRSG